MSRIEILRRYAAGDELAGISKGLGLEHEAVVEVVSQLGFTRSRAAEELKKLDASRPRPPIPPAFAAGPVPDLDIRPRVKEKPVLNPHDVEMVLTKAEQLGGRLAARAGKVRATVLDIAEEIEASAGVLEAEAKVAELQAKLDQARLSLRTLKPAKAPSGASRSRPIREWAAKNGVACPSHGRVPREVVEAYEKAQAS